VCETKHSTKYQQTLFPNFHCRIDQYLIDGWLAYENFCKRLCKSVCISNGQTMDNKLFWFIT
jgi:hypothetical protein